MRKICKNTISWIIAVLMILTSMSAFAKTGAYAGDGSGDIIYSLDESVSVAKNGTKNVKFELPEKTTTGIYTLDMTANFSQIGNVPMLLSALTDVGGTEIQLASLLVTDTGEVKLRCSTATNDYTFLSAGEAKNTGVVLETGKDYNFKLCFSLDTRELFVFINSEQVLSETKLFIREFTSVTNVKSDPAYANTESNAKYTVSNFVFKKDTIKPEYRINFCYEEDFENFNASKYLDGAANNLPQIETGIDKYGKESKIWKTSKTAASRVLLDASSNSTYRNLGGLIESSVDFKFDAMPTGDFEIMRSENNQRNESVYDVYAKSDGKLYLKAQNIGLKWNETDQYKLYQPWALGDPSFASIEAGTWYTLKVCYDTYSKRFWIYLDGKLCNGDKDYFVNTVGNYATFLRIDHTRDYANAIIEYDNFKHVAYGRTEQDGYTIIDRQLFNNGLGSHSENAASYYKGATQFGIQNANVNADRQLVVGTGAYAIAQMSELKPLYGGIYRVSADFKFSTLNTTAGADAFISTVNTNYQKLSSLAQINGSLYAFVRTDYNTDATRKYVKLIDAIDTEKWYNVAYSIDTNTRRLHYYVNGEEVAAEYIMYVPTDAECKILRPLSIDGSKNGNGRVIVDNFILSKFNLDSEINLDSKVVKSDVALPTAALGANIIWSSSEPEVLAADGTVNNAELESAKYVTLTAKVPVSGEKEDHRTYESKSFTFPVYPDKNSIKVDYKNDRAEGNFYLYGLCGESIPTAKAVIAVYNADGRLELVRTVNTNEYNNNNNLSKGVINSYEQTTGLASGTYKVKGFLFDSMSNIKPLSVSDEKEFVK